MTDNKQKLFEILNQFGVPDGDENYFDYIKQRVDEIDALYHRDCGKCRHLSNVLYCLENDANCTWAGTTIDKFEEATE